MFFLYLCSRKSYQQVSFMIKALFFDIDGTLVSFRTHSIPVSTVEALTKAKMQGIKIFISTGRPYRIINNLDSIKHLIDGYVTTNGAYNFIGSHVVSCNPIPLKDVMATIELADTMNFACVVVGEKDLAVYNSNSAIDRIFGRLLNVPDIGDNTPIEIVLKQRILQMSPIINETEEAVLMPRLTECISNRWHPDFTDITERNADKGRGLASIAAFEGLDLSETMAFGDGGNDISIIERAGIGVAMGNAGEQVQAAADYVTTSVDEDGIKQAFLHFGLI